MLNCSGEKKNPGPFEPGWMSSLRRAYTRVRLTVLLASKRNRLTHSGGKSDLQLACLQLRDSGGLSPRFPHRITNR